jgi:hypothetical protein
VETSEVEVAGNMAVGGEVVHGIGRSETRLQEQDVVLGWSSCQRGRRGLGEPVTTDDEDATEARRAG